MKYNIYFFFVNLFIHTNGAYHDLTEDDIIPKKEENSFEKEAIKIANEYRKPFIKECEGEYIKGKNKAKKEALNRFSNKLRGYLQSKQGFVCLNITYCLFAIGAIICFLFNGVVHEGILHLQRSWSFIVMEIMNMLLYIITMNRSELKNEELKEKKWRFRLCQIFLFLLNLPPFIFTFINSIIDTEDNDTLNECSIYTGSDTCDSPLAKVMMLLYAFMLFMCVLKLVL